LKKYNFVFQRTRREHRLNVWQSLLAPLNGKALCRKANYFMGEITEHTFRTKTGSCVITPDKILLTRENVRGAMSQHIFGNSIGRALLIYGLFGLSALALGVWSFTNRNYSEATILCLIGTLLLYSVVASRNNSAAPAIDRSAIHSINAHSPHPPATRGYFTVIFEENGKIRKRLILLPGSLENGREEYARAESIMRASGLLTMNKEISA
jgi:hypothetical protein